MKIFSKLILAACVIFLSINTSYAINVDTTIRVDQEHHSISAPDALIHQWYINGEKIEGATKRDLAIKKTGTYKVEITNIRGEKTEIESSFLVTAAGAIIKIYIIGDSTVCNYSASDYPWAGWGQVIPSFFNTANLSFTNKAIGGRSSRSFFEEGRWTPIRDALVPGDYVFIQWGHNDRDFSNASRYTPVADYKNYLIMYCNETKAKGAIPVLISPMVLNAWTGTTMRNVFTENGNNYRGAMLEVANELNVAFVDLNMKSWNLYKTYGSVYNQHFIYKGFNPGEYPNYPVGITDGTHFQEMGAICNARMIVQGISELSARADMANLISNIKPQYSIAVSVNPVGKDSMTTKSYSYPSGLTVTLKTIPKKSSTFQKWNNAANTQISTATLTTVTSGTAATSYTAIYAGATTCSSSITSSTTAICAGSSVVLTASTGASYKWFNGTTQVGTAATYTATAAGNYTVEVTNAVGCKATAAVKTITVNPLPSITQFVKVDADAWLTAATATVCEASTVNLGPQPNLAAGWSWTGPNNFTSTLRNPVLSNVTVANAGNYIVTYTDPNGCKATSTFVLQVTKPTATIIAPTTSFCTGGSLLLTSSTGASYKWFNGTTQVGTAATYTATAAGAYTVEVTNTAGCKATSAVTQISVNTLPTATITSSATSFCTGGSVLLTASTGSSYKWFNGTTQVGTAATYTATAAGAYTVEVTNAAGCKATSTVTQIAVNALPTATITSPATSFCTGGSVVLTSSAGASYKWFNGTTQVGTAVTYTATVAGAYTVEVTNAEGCKATSAVTQISVTSTVTWYADIDNDGVGDIANTLNACTKPTGYVANSGDDCPADANKITSGNCGCGQSETSCLDCNGTPNGTAFLDNCSICVGGTTGKTVCITTSTTGGSNIQNSVSTYPQPFTNSLTISLENKIIRSVTFLNLQGLIIEYRQGINASEIQMGESLSSGIYFIMIETETEVYTTKAIKY
ncbi:GDSL-type esterase/lipase family protein [Cytophaga aurantiaca]|uniref:Ig-like domain-containing protein n=1 Tax=Cytophaga aurantiaca TaxID=29530 RepID=UPI0012FA4024|nr:GDSL-type esterase/lipase family protein [Cytophaga aurantiaca]